MDWIISCIVMWPPWKHNTPYWPNGRLFCHDDIAEGFAESLAVVVWVILGGMWLDDMRDKRVEQWVWINNIWGCGTNEEVESVILDKRDDIVININIMSALKLKER